MMILNWELSKKFVLAQHGRKCTGMSSSRDLVGALGLFGKPQATFYLAEDDAKALPRFGAVDYLPR
jgi:hypothetical protein